MAIQGLRDTLDFDIGGVRAQRPENWREGSLLLFPNGSAPLMALSSVMRQESTDDPKFHWFEKVMEDQRLLFPAGAIGVTTTLTWATATPQWNTNLKVGTLLRLEHTGEIVRVTVPQATDTTTTVTRSVGTTAAATFTVGGNGVNPYATIIGSANEEGSSAPAAIAYDPVERYNLTQIFRNSLAMTETARRTRLRTGDQVREAKREALQYHNIEMERAAWLGELVNNGGLGVAYSGTNGPIRTTEGFLPWLFRQGGGNTSATDPVASGPRTLTNSNTTGNITITNMENVLKSVFDYGSTEKVAFMGNTAALAIQRAIRLGTNVSWNLSQGQKEFGMNVMRLTSPFGDVVMKTHPLFNRLPGGEAGSGQYFGMDSTICFMDMEYVRYRYLTGRDTRFDGNEEQPGDDQMKGGYLTEMGFEFRFPNAHFIWKNVANGVA